MLEHLAENIDDSVKTALLRDGLWSCNKACEE